MKTQFAPIVIEALERRYRVLEAHELERGGVYLASNSEKYIVLDVEETDAIITNFEARSSDAKSWYYSDSVDPNFNTIELTEKVGRIYPAGIYGVTGSTSDFRGHQVYRNRAGEICVILADSDQDYVAHSCVVSNLSNSPATLRYYYPNGKQFELFDSPQDLIELIGEIALDEDIRAANAPSFN